MIPSNLPKNVVLAETREREEDEDESLKDLYQELDLKNLTLVAIDSRSPGFYKKIPKYPPYGGKTVSLDGLDKEMSYAELLGRVCKTLQWPIDEIRLWDQSQFEDFVSETYDPFNTSAYRDLVPRFVSLDEFEVVFPMFLSDMYVVAERFAGREPEFPPNARPEVLTRNEWWLSVLEQWEGRQPEIDRTAYGVVEVVRMERNARNNTLFSSLGYLFHVIAKVKGEEEIDDMKQGILQPSRFRAPQMRLKLARFAADNAKQLEKSGILAETSAKTAREYIEAVLSPEYPGGDVDLAIAAVASGALVQVFDVRTQRLKQYGRGFVERYQNPKRLGPRGAVKLALWADGSYDPIAFCLERGMYPDRMEKPFCMAYAIKSFEWLREQKETQTNDMAPCASCGTVESPGRKRYATCSHCRSVYYCDKRCQLLHWRDGHKGVCQDRDFAKEAAQSRADESEALQRFMPEIERRLEQREGVGFYRQIAERGFGGGDAAGEAKSSVEEMGGQENGEGRVNE